MGWKGRRRADGIDRGVRREVKGEGKWGER